MHYTYNYKHFYLESLSKAYQLRYKCYKSHYEFDLKMIFGPIASSTTKAVMMTHCT